MFIDAHCHLEQLEDIDKIIEKAKKNNIGKIVAVSEDLESMKKIIKIKEKYGDIIVVGLGIHPTKILKLDNKEIEESINFIEKNIEIVDIIGEIGLDYKYAKEPHLKERQKTFLNVQLELAKKYKKPINLHSRWAQRQVLQIGEAFFKETKVGTCLHWFTSSKKLIKRALENNLFITIGPTVVYNEETQKVVKDIKNLSKILVETDAPVPYKLPYQSEPSLVIHVINKLSEIFNKSIEELEKIIEENFHNYLNNKVEI